MFNVLLFDFISLHLDYDSDTFKKCSDHRFLKDVFGERGIIKLIYA